MTAARKNNSNKLLEVIKHALTENKARNVTVLDLRKIDNAVCEYFVVCHGTSRTHVNSLANNTVVEVRETIEEKPYKKEGMMNGEWVLLDYSNIVVHIFQQATREFYNIEGLWADAEIEVLPDEF